MWRHSRHHNATVPQCRRGEAAAQPTSRHAPDIPGPLLRPNATRRDSGDTKRGTRITAELERQFAEGARLEEEIRISLMSVQNDN